MNNVFWRPADGFYAVDRRAALALVDAITAVPSPQEQADTARLEAERAWQAEQKQARRAAQVQLKKKRKEAAATATTTTTTHPTTRRRLLGTCSWPSWPSFPKPAHPFSCGRVWRAGQPKQQRDTQTDKQQAGT
ncbi:hypothetical protein SPI_08690 [Niveomyces insectorum RCEF 264]|uniref:Uncharacterized protein n=1 Tax=Niveomyces insectorum RCEF 264 TaxID=1081102 RepID=A0A167MVZ7_9HYPO|nr:hypothetical protein SPI_08690 [Niveomyces insectorum RCEF 264]